MASTTVTFRFDSTATGTVYATPLGRAADGPDGTLLDLGTPKSATLSSGSASITLPENRLYVLTADISVGGVKAFVAPRVASGGPNGPQVDFAESRLLRSASQF